MQVYITICNHICNIEGYANIYNHIEYNMQSYKTILKKMTINKHIEKNLIQPMVFNHIERYQAYIHIEQYASVNNHIVKLANIYN